MNPGTRNGSPDGPSPGDSAPDASRDLALALLVEQISERVHRREAIDWESLYHENPQHAGQIRALFPALECLAQLDRQSDADIDRLGTDESEGSMRVIGDYQIVREIARGGMGIVYEALQRPLDRRVALKVLPFAATLDPRALARFQQESLAAAQLDHPHIVPVYGVGSDRGVHYYAMRYVDGHSLAEVIHEMERRECEPPHAVAQSPAATSIQDSGFRPARIRNPKSQIPNFHSPSTLELRAPGLSTDRAGNRKEFYRGVARLGIQAAEALDYAHGQGVLHRDIKPGNLLLDDAGNVYITDFGLARIETAAHLTQTGDLMGTLRYMSPEQATAARGLVDQRSDVYSLGATLYELLTLRPVFTADDRAVLLKQIVDDDPVSPRKLDRSFPKELETILLTCLEKDSARRYTTAQMLADDLKRLLDDRPLAAQPATWPVRIAKWSRRHRKLALVLLATLAVSTVCLAVSTVWVTHERNSARAAEHERRLQVELAENNLESAVETVRKLLSSVSQDKLLTTPGATQLRQTLLHDAALQLESLSRNQGDPGLLLQTAAAFREIGVIHNHVGEFESALEPLRRARGFLAASIAASQDRRPTAMHGAEQSTIAFALAHTYWYLQKLAEAEIAASESVSVLRTLIDEHGISKHVGGLAGALRLRGQIRSARLQFLTATQDLEEALALLRKSAGDQAGWEWAVWRLNECGLLIDIAVLRQRQDDLAGAIRLMREASEIADAVVADTDRLRRDNPEGVAAGERGPFPMPVSRQARWLSARAHGVVGRWQLTDVEDLATLRNEFQVAVTMLEPVVMEFPDIVWNRPVLLKSMAGLACTTQGDESKPLWERTIQLWRDLAGEPNGIRDSNWVAWSIIVSDQAENLQDVAREIAQHAVDAGQDPDDPNTLGIALYRVGRDADAVVNLLKDEESVDESKPPYNYAFLSMAHCRLAHHEEARQWYDKLVAWMNSHASKNAILIRFQLEAARLLGVTEPLTPH